MTAFPPAKRTPVARAAKSGTPPRAAHAAGAAPLSAGVGKTLILTEKPSVARDIVAALGGFSAYESQAYWESADYVCTYAVGHLLSLLDPEDIDPGLKRWSLETLPIIPATFQWKPIAGHERRLHIIRALMDRPDVTGLVNACDAAREGELIFRELVRYFDCRKTVRRLWLQSMTPAAIRAGFASLRAGADLDGLGDAAECRAKSDWLIGMNATRAFSKRLKSNRDTAPWSVGRVQTPTLALLVARELEILGHEPQPFQRVVARFRVDGAPAGAAPSGQPPEAHEYDGTWFDPTFKKQELKPELKDDRLYDRPRAEAIAAKVKGRRGEAAETREESLRHAPPLFSLTGLQKYMASRFKWSAKRTLEAAQRCYETHKVLTYPRTSSSCLPSDYRGEVRRLVEGLAGTAVFAESAGYLLVNGLRNEARTFDDKGVSDHFAIIPTDKGAGPLRELSGDDGRLYDAVVRRFLATFFPPAVYDKVRRTTVVAGEHFRTGPLETLVVPGWLAVYDKVAERPEDGEAAGKSLPPLKPGDKKASGVAATTAALTIKEEATKPPPRINEAGLLGLMEHAGRQVESEELASALMSAEGLGTAATRADIIQNLKAKQYVDETLRPTVKGIHLISMLRRIRAERLTSPELTARLELELNEVEQGARAAARYMTEIARYVTEVVEIAKGFDLDQVFPDAAPLGPCPRCGEPVFERAVLYACRTVRWPEKGCGFEIGKDALGRYVDRHAVETLLRDGSTRELEGLKTPAGREFRARLELKDGAVRLSDTPGLSESERDLGGAGAAGGEPQRSGASARAAVGVCPVHAGQPCQVIETRNAYVCERRLQAFAAGDKAPVGILLPKTLCRRELKPDEVRRLLETGATAELSGFISKAGKAFSATLKLSPTGGFAFEFTPRGGAAPAPAGAVAAAPSEAAKPRTTIRRKPGSLPRRNPEG